MKKLTIAELIMLILIIICIIASIAFIPKTIQCAKMQIGEMPGYCLYLLPK